MSLSIDPLFSITFIMSQFAQRYIRFEITKGQEKLISEKATQSILYFAAIFFSTRNIGLSIFIWILTLLLLKVLLNEEHKYNILPKNWLFQNNFINEYKSDKNTYLENIVKEHYR